MPTKPGHTAAHDLLIWGGAIALGVGAALFSGLDSSKRPIPAKPVSVAEQFRTTTPHGETDSLAVYRGANGQPSLLFATDKQGNRLQMFDAATGQFIRDIGTQGEEPGQLRRPNGVAVWQPTGDSTAAYEQRTAMLIVVEHGGRRVQAFELPGLKPICVFGEGDLTKPYGVAICPDSAGRPAIFVTDNAWRMSQRVRRYVWHEDRFVCNLVFGETSGPGVLRLVESIAADPQFHRLYICDEHRQSRNVKVYSDEGAFLGLTFGDRYITDDPEGIALWPNGSAGWIVVTNQGKQQSIFHLFDRASLIHVGAFIGNPSIANTDGIALSPGTLGQLTGGGFFAVDNDGFVAAYGLNDIAAAAGLKK